MAMSRKRIREAGEELVRRGTDKERAIAVLAHALWHIDDGSIDEAVVIRALLEHAAAIAHGQWELAEVRRVIDEIVDDVLVAGELEHCE